MLCEEFTSQSFVRCQDALLNELKIKWTGLVVHDVLQYIPEIGFASLVTSAILKKVDFGTHAVCLLQSDFENLLKECQVLGVDVERLLQRKDLLWFSNLFEKSPKTIGDGAKLVKEWIRGLCMHFERTFAQLFLTFVCSAQDVEDQKDVFEAGDETSGLNENDGVQLDQEDSETEDEGINVNDSSNDAPERNGYSFSFSLSLSPFRLISAPTSIPLFVCILSPSRLVSSFGCLPSIQPLLLVHHQPQWRYDWLGLLSLPSNVR